MKNRLYPKSCSLRFFKLNFFGGLYVNDFKISKIPLLIICNMCTLKRAKLI